MTGDTLSLLSLLGMVAVLLLVLGACWLFTRWAGTGLAGHFGVPVDRRQMKVVERLAVGRDQALLVVQLAGRTFLIGSSPSGFSLPVGRTDGGGGGLMGRTPSRRGRRGERKPGFSRYPAEVPG